MAAIKFFDEVLLDDAYYSGKFFSDSRTAIKKLFQSLFYYNHNQIIDRRINKLMQGSTDKRWDELREAERLHHIYTCSARANAIRRMIKLKY